MQNRTIAAVSTPYGRGAISLIRLTGCDSIEIADKVFKPKNKTSLANSAHAHAVYGDIVSNGTVIDDGVATVFRAPYSYTGWQPKWTRRQRG